MPVTAQGLLDAARQPANPPLDELAPTIIQAVIVHRRSQRWVVKYLKDNGFSISKSTLSRHLKRVGEPWQAVLHLALTRTHFNKRRIEIRRLSADCSAFHLPDGTSWVLAPYSNSIEDFQRQVKSYAAQTSYVVRIEDTSSGIWLLPIIST